MQGNSTEELPEYLLVCIRVHRVDLLKMRYFSDMALEASEAILPEAEAPKDAAGSKGVEGME